MCVCNPNKTDIFCENCCYFLQDQYKVLVDKYSKILNCLKFFADHQSCHACDYQASAAKRALIEIGEEI